MTWLRASADTAVALSRGRHCRDGNGITIGCSGLADFTACMIPDAHHRVVVLTPPGAGAIGVVRVVGPDAVSLVNQAFHPVSSGGLSAAQGDHLRYGHFVDGTETIDDVIVSATMLGSYEATEGLPIADFQLPIVDCRLSIEGDRHEGTEARRQEGKESHGATEPRNHEGGRHEGTQTLGNRHQAVGPLPHPDVYRDGSDSTIDNRQSTIRGGFTRVIEDEVKRGPQWVVDISAHGGVRVIERILQTLERLGATVGEPGEAVGLAWPTRSLIEHEIIEALTRAKTERAVRFLAWQRENLPAELESVASLCKSDPAQARKRLTAAADGYRIARTLIEGVTVALVGPPNSGKSTLFNRLIGRPATVVSPQPGTTRDWVAEAVEMDGVPITLVDTAGRWDSADPLERQAVEAGRLVMERAEVRLLLLDGSQSLSLPGEKLLAAARTWDGCVTVITKSDAGAAWQSWNGTDGQAASGTRRMVFVSGLTGAGCDILVSAILEILGYRGWVESVPCLFTARQAEAAANALSVLPQDAMAAEQRLERCLIGRCEQVTTTGGGL